jgi:hypothetical protein
VARNSSELENIVGKEEKYMDGGAAEGKTQITTR